MESLNRKVKDKVLRGHTLFELSLGNRRSSENLAKREAVSFVGSWGSYLFFLVRKICPELTSVADPPFFFCLRKIRPELISVPVFLYFVCGSPATAWPLTSGVGLYPGTEPRLPKQSVLNLTTRPQGWLLF